MTNHHPTTMTTLRTHLLDTLTAVENTPGLRSPGLITAIARLTYSVEHGTPAHA